MASTINASTSAGLVQTADTSGVLQLQSNGTAALTTSGANLTVGGLLTFQATTLPTAGTASIFNRSSDSTMYLQAATGGGINLLDGSQNSMATLASTSVQFLTNNLARQTISSAGYVTFPYQVAVEVNRQSNFAVTSDQTTGTVVPFNSETLDVGNNFSTSTYRFTAPVTGKYEFHWSYACNLASNTVYRTYLWINGTRRVDTQLRNDNSKTGSAYSWGSRVMILGLNANDYVELRASSDNATDFYADGELMVSMGISLIS